MAIAIGMVGCGATAEAGAATFYTQHVGEPPAPAGLCPLSQPIWPRFRHLPSRANLEALAVAASTARRTLLAAANWTVSENGEEEGVGSQAELEINEGAGAMLKAMTAIRQYAGTESRASLVLYRQDLKGGRERWNQGMEELWHLLRKLTPRRSSGRSDR